jgi:hypothetical protein
MKQINDVIHEINIVFVDKPDPSLFKFNSDDYL